jgi:hypothetical protein
LQNGEKDYSEDAKADTNYRIMKKEKETHVWAEVGKGE